ncbi:hypothetical protein MesoLj131b_21450 [Mesorhizobium sp. 131-2-5]|uniref:LysR family transcriptional regulator n=1 Tax=Mesorhizobium sp. 131-2-5 TaxID=2744519 RepID=UPI00192935BD|nr:LysR family transcriptional regulator [Mesorhizobium sp. 131-2-5]BCH00146.1 hypothetical protein MesoLj131b_21450 [Mesorhizobium sp. 131-2-5]
MDRLMAMNTFIRVIETGSFSAAARHLRVGQPAVSKAIAQLEERLGVRLLSRTTRGLSPTDAGVSFYEGAKRAVDEADEAENTARGTAAALTGLLRIGTSVTFGRLHVVPRLKAFLDAHPRLRVTSAEGIREAVLAGIGFTVGSEWMFDAELRSGAVRPILVDWALPPVELWALFPAGRKASVRARTFVEFLASSL